MSDFPLFSLMLAAPLCAVSPRNGRVVHAVTMEEIARRAADTRITFDAPCGARRLKLLAVFDPKAVYSWPPRVSALVEGVTRCAECHELTGRRRPDPKVWPK